MRTAFYAEESIVSISGVTIINITDFIMNFLIVQKFLAWNLHVTERIDSVGGTEFLNDSCWLLSNGIRNST